MPTRPPAPLACTCADIIGSVTLLVVKGDERVGSYRTQMQHLQAYSQINGLTQVRLSGARAALSVLPLRSGTHGGLLS